MARLGPRPNRCGLLRASPVCDTGSNPQLGWLGLGPGLKPGGKNSKMSSPFTQSVSPVPTSLKWCSSTIVFYWSVQRMAAIGGGRARMGVGCSHSILCVLYSSALFV